jgi:hypothetical protein
MITKKKISLIIFLAVFLLVIGMLFAKADDDEEDDDNSSSSRETVEYITKTVVVEPAKTVYEKVVKSVEFPDTDRDGLADVEDPHPNVAEIYIVKDDNQNGIVDQFENSK